MNAFNLSPHQLRPTTGSVPTGIGQFRELAASGQLSQQRNHPVVDVDALMNVAYGNPMFENANSFGQFAV
jgi:hypothetical protein